MDWGLLRGTKGGLTNRLLRDKIKYPPCLYIFSAITNLLLRFAWVLGLVPNAYWLDRMPRAFTDYQMLFFALSLAEAYRRAQWSLFRVENENINNYEKYRTIHEIPKVVDEHYISDDE